MEALTEWIEMNKGWFWWLFAGSLAVFLGSLVAVPWIVVRLPPDYFARERRISWERLDGHPVIQAGMIVLKNFVGVAFFAAGLAMLVLPGQGLLTMFMGMVLVDFPGKYRLQRYIVSRPAVFRSLNWLRRRRGRKPLVL